MVGRYSWLTAVLGKGVERGTMFDNLNEKKKKNENEMGFGWEGKRTYLNHQTISKLRASSYIIKVVDCGSDS